MTGGKTTTLRADPAAHEPQGPAPHEKTVARLGWWPESEERVWVFVKKTYAQSFWLPAVFIKAYLGSQSTKDVACLQLRDGMRFEAALESMTPRDVLFDASEGAEEQWF